METELNLQTSPFAPGLTVVEASAGTGKTYSISHLVPRLLIEGALPDLAKLLLVTFTKDAARELADRVRRVLTQLAAPPTPDELAGNAFRDIAALRPLLGDPAARARLDRAIIDLDLLAVSTIHAFCQRTLQHEGTLCGIPVLPEVVTNDADYLDPLVRTLWITTLSRDPILAAIATAQSWKITHALTFINTRRRCLQPAAEPSVPAYTELCKKIPALTATLRSVEAQDALRAHLTPVTRWNKKSSLDAIFKKIKTCLAHSNQQVAFWQELATLVDLSDYVGNTGGNKIIRATLADTVWVRAASELQSLVNHLQWAWQQALADDAIPALALFMAKHRLITHDGLIGTLYRALHREDHEGEQSSARLANRLADRYHVALIDESQDTDPRQFAIFERIFLRAHPRRRLLLVGDPKQAIFGFRGADLATYLAARARADTTYTLSKTFRAPAPLVDVINTFFQPATAFHHTAMVFTPARSGLNVNHQLWRKGQPCSPLEVWITPEADKKIYSSQSRRSSAFSERIASTIVDLLAHGKLRESPLAPAHAAASREREVTPKDFAVLVATHRQAGAMAHALQRRGVPAVINSGADVFATEEARDLQVLLGAILDPRRSARLRHALATRLIGLDAAAIHSLDTLLPTAPGTAARAEPVAAPSPAPAPSSWLELFGHWQATWTKQGLVALFAELERTTLPLNDRGVTQRLALTPLSGERRATNYRHLTDLLLSAARDIAPRPEELVRWLGQQITRAEDRVDAEERKLQLSSDRAAVQVVTLHTAKGLEYPLVFCPYLADPLKKTKACEKISGRPTVQNPIPTDTLLNLDLCTVDDQARHRQALLAAQLEERLRLTYVALTRAQVRLWICSYSSTKDDLASPLDWLWRPPLEAATHRNYSTEWVALAQKDRATRHEQALRALGARACEENPPDNDLSAPPLTPADQADPTATPAAGLIVFRSPPEPTTDVFSQPDPAIATSGRLGRGTTADLPSPGDSSHWGALPAPFVPPSWRITSFSALTREPHAHGTPSAAHEPAPAPAAHLAAALDHPTATIPANDPGTTTSRLINQGDASSAAAGPSPAASGAPAPAFLNAPSNALVGTVVHAWIQTWDLSPLAPIDEPHAPLKQQLATASLPGLREGQPAWLPTLHALFSDLREIHLPGWGETPLHTLCPDAHGSEWNFHLPLAGRLSIKALADCFERHAHPDHRSYAPILAAVSEEKFEGLLQGFIDRLARHGSQWGLIDWKTNRLGPLLTDYETPALLRCAMDSHYLLQTHLYLIALRRYLRSGGHGDAPITGAWLVFLRAIAPGETRGVLHIDPPPAMLDALDQLFASALTP